MCTKLRKVMRPFFILIILVSTSACSVDNNTVNEEERIDTDLISESDDEGRRSLDQSNIIGEGDTPVVIQMNDLLVKATLNDTQTAREFIDLLPFTVTASRAADDICGSVSQELGSDSSQGQTSWEIGEIGWFGGWFTILVDNEERFSDMPGVMIIGTINDEYIEAVQSLSGTIDIVVSLDEEALKEKEKKDDGEMTEEDRQALEKITYEFREAPGEYLQPADQAGTIERFSYLAHTSEDESLEKDALVYLPYGYSERSRDAYNILYLMHGANGNENVWFGGEAGRTSLKNIIDNMIEREDIDPLIIVTPTYYNGEAEEFIDGDLTRLFQKEFANDLMPAIEEEYATFAKSTSEEDLIESRNHRAFGGYSMGSVTTWFAFAENLRYIEFFMPMSAESWILETMGGLNRPDETVERLSQEVENQGYSGEDFYVYTSAGEFDFAFDGVNNMVNAMKTNDSVFELTDNFFYGNIHYDLAPGHYHDYPYGNHNIYNALPTFFSQY